MVLLQRKQVADRALLDITIAIAPSFSIEKPNVSRVDVPEFPIVPLADVGAIGYGCTAERRERCQTKRSCERRLGKHSGVESWRPAPQPHIRRTRCRSAMCRVRDDDSAQEIEFEIEFRQDGATQENEIRHLHPRCFAAWEFERTKVTER
jgi:hypothetical protein